MEGSPAPDWLALQEAIQSVHAYAASIEGEVEQLRKALNGVADTTFINSRKIRKLKRAKSVCFYCWFSSFLLMAPVSTSFHTAMSQASARSSTLLSCVSISA